MILNLTTRVIMSQAHQIHTFNYELWDNFGGKSTI